MALYNHILFATDLSAGCEKVARKAWHIAENVGSKLSMVHVIEPIPAYGYPGVTDIQSPVINHARDELQRIAAQLNIPEEQQFIEVGSVKHHILAMAEKLNVDLIIVGTHGRHGISRLLGSTTSAVIHGVHCDVLTVRAEE